MKKIYFICAVFFALGASAQTMYVRPIFGNQSIYPVANIQKLTFENGNLLVTNTTGSNGLYALADNRYINFTDLTLGTINPIAVENRFYVYPNPSNQWLNIANTNSSQTPNFVEVISVEGKLLMQYNPSTANYQIDISTLPQGMYLCKIISGNQMQTLKFLKQ